MEPSQALLPHRESRDKLEWNKVRETWTRTQEPHGQVMVRCPPHWSLSLGDGKLYPSPIINKRATRVFTTPLSSTNISSSHTPCSATSDNLDIWICFNLASHSGINHGVGVCNSAHSYPTAGFWWETCPEILSFVLFEPPDHIHYITTRKEAYGQIWRGLKTCSTILESTLVSSTFKWSHCELGRKFASAWLVRWRAAFCWRYFLLTQDNQSLDEKPWH